MSRLRLLVGTFLFGLGLCLASGCRDLDNRPAQSNANSLVIDNQPTRKLAPEQIADVQIQMATSFEKENKFDEAMAAYQKALSHDPKRTDAAERLAVLYDRQGDFVNSAPLHRKAIAAQPNQPDYLCNFGYSLYLQKHWQEAEAQFRKVLALNPQHERASNNLGLVLARSGRSMEALAEFQKNCHNKAEPYLNLAFALALEKNWSEARNQFELALQYDPSSALAKKGLQQMNIQIVRATTQMPVEMQAEMNLPGPIKTGSDSLPFKGSDSVVGGPLPQSDKQTISADSGALQIPLTKIVELLPQENSTNSSAPRTGN
jgi:Tfp pilus assembly protein PilF